MNKRGELYLETPEGEFLLLPFIYGNGREGYMALKEVVNEPPFRFNLTINLEDVNPEHIILKEWGHGESLVKHLMEKTNTFNKIAVKSVGLNTAIIVKLNPDFYE